MFDLPLNDMATLLSPLTFLTLHAMCHTTKNTFVTVMQQSSHTYMNHRYVRTMVRSSRLAMQETSFHAHPIPLTHLLSWAACATLKNMQLILKMLVKE